MKRMMIFGFLLLLALGCQATGLIVLQDPSRDRIGPIRPPEPIPPPRPLPPPRPHWQPLQLQKHAATIKVKDQVATTTVEQEFYNPNQQRVEGTFLLPVPKGARFDKFTMEIDGKAVPAELLAADKARQIYEDIVRNQRDPALLEYLGQDLYKVRIFPIEPMSRKKVTLSYMEMLKSDFGLIGLSHTLARPSQPIASFSFKVELESREPLKAVYSPSHTVEIRRPDDRHAVIGFEATNYLPERNFQLLFRPQKGEIGISLLTYKPAGEDGYFLLFANPQVAEEKEAAPKDILFVFDTSGSMSGAKIQQAKKALQFCVENLNPQDRFDILRFSTDVEPLFQTLTPATPENRDKAQAFISNINALGGTAIYDALAKAMAMRTQSTDRPCVVVFVTDGLPTIGPTREEEIVDAVKTKDGETLRVFSFGVGNDVNTHLLDKIAEKTFAFSTYVLPDEDLEVKLSNFFSKIKDPVLTSVALKFPDHIRATQLHPQPFPDLFRGDQLVVAGRFNQPGKGKIELSGKVRGQTKSFTFDVDFGQGESSHDYIPRLWASKRVGFLLEELRLRGETKEVRDEVTELARKYGIVTPYTAYLILEDEQRRNIPLSQQTLPQIQADARARSEAQRYFQSYAREKSGEANVASVAANKSVQAGVSFDSTADANKLLSRSAPAPTRELLESKRALPLEQYNQLSSKDRVLYSVQQSKYVSGKSFYQNQFQWVDSEVQKAPANAKKQRVAFNSDEYFALLAKTPALAKYFSAGSNVQVYFGGTVYEVYEGTESRL